MMQKKTPAKGVNHKAGDQTDTLIVTPGSEHGKTFANLQAQLALRGHWLHALKDGGFIVGAWSYSRTLPSLESVRDFLLKIGGAA